LDRDGAGRLDEFNRPRGWQRYFRQQTFGQRRFPGRSRRNCRTIMHRARRPAGAKNRQHFVHQASEERLFRAGLGGGRGLPGGGRRDHKPWLVGLGLIAVPDPKLDQLASAQDLVIARQGSKPRPHGGRIGIK
jgi:hypothetical protein